MFCGPSISFPRGKTFDYFFLQEHGFFNDSSKYRHVKVSDLQVDDKDGDINVTFKLCLVLKSNAGYIEDVIKMWNKFDNEGVTGLEFQAGECIVVVMKTFLPIRRPY